MKGLILGSLISTATEILDEGTEDERVVLTDLLPAEAQLLGDVEWNGVIYFKIWGKGVTQNQHTNWNKYKGVYRIPVAPSKVLGMGVLSEELDSEVLLELKDFELDTSLPNDPARKIATQLLLRIANNSNVDVFKSKFTTVITQLGANTTLTPQGAINLIKKLQSEKYQGVLS